MNAIIEFLLRPLSSGLFLWVFPIFVCLQVADAATTLKVLSQGGRELNPFMKKLMDFFGPARALFGFKVALCLGAYVYLHANLLVGLCALYVAVVVHNIRQIRP